MKSYPWKGRFRLPQPVARKVAHAVVGEELKRAWLPLEIHPISAGIKGGLAGSVAMAVLAMIYGLSSGNGIWYPINLLAAGFLASTRTETTAQLAAFQMDVLLIAIPIHLVTSLLVGLLYGAMLPMLPRRADSAGRLHRALDVVGPDLRHSRNRQSGDE